MILPTTYQAALLLLVLSMLCLGSWANMQKLAGKWRFELFYYDYSLGLLLWAAAAAYTLGSMNPKELTFTDNLLIVTYHQIAYGVAGGAVFNLANLLLVAAIAVSGMAVAFPIAMGLAVLVGVVWDYALNPQGNLILLSGGALMVLVAVIIDAFAYAGHLDAQAAAAKAAALQADPRAKAAAKSAGVAKPTGAARGIVLSVLSGILMSLSVPLVDLGKGGENGLSPYGMAVLFGGGVLLTTFLYVPFFANFPVSGGPIPVGHYFRGTKKQHLWGLFGGIVWATGAIAGFAAASTPPTVRIAPALSYVLGQSAPLVSALWGLIVWREFKGADARTQMLLVATIVLFLGGVAMVSIAPLYAAK